MSVEQGLGVEPIYAGIVMLKPDALEDRLDDKILGFVDDQPGLRVATTNAVTLGVTDLLEMYQHELVEDPSERREILMVITSMAMADSVSLVAVTEVEAASDFEDVFVRLNRLKGTTGTDDMSTIRGVFPFPQPDDFEERSFWFRAPFFVRNRVHVPDSLAALNALIGAAERTGCEYDEMYPDSRYVDPRSIS